MEHEVQGRKISCVKREYGAFTDKLTGEQRPGGFTHWLWLDQGPTSGPVEIRLKEDAYGVLDKVPAGQAVTVLCEVVARNNRATYRAVEVLATGAKAA